MIEDGVDPSSILLFTFTRKGANEIQERISTYIGDAAKLVTVGTYHSFCLRLLRKYAEYVGRKPNFSIYDTDDQTEVIANIGKEMGLEDFKASLVKIVISKYKDEMISPEQAMQTAQSPYHKKLAEVYAQYCNKMKLLNAFDFDDLIYYAVRLLENYPEIHKSVNKRYQYIVADEVQDSSPRDLKLIEYLGGDSMNVCLVGDSDQSIYSFRGSNINALFDFVKQYNMKKYILGRNYRSTQTIVNAAKSMIQQNERLFERDIYSKNELGEKIKAYPMADQQLEAGQVVKRIKQAHREGYAYKDIAVLYRMSFISRKIEEELLKNNIPYHIHNGMPFCYRSEIKDILCYIKFLLNPFDRMAFERIVNIPKKHIGERTLDKIFLRQEELSACTSNIIDLVDACEQTKLSKRQQSGLDLFLEHISILKSTIDNCKPSDFISLIIKTIGYYDYLGTLEKGEALDDKIANLMELKDIANEYATLEEFTQSIAVNSDVDDTDEDSDKVTLMTMHSSKGLEFPYVIIAGAAEGIIPSRRSMMEDKLQEERRVFYVAMTRAKKKLAITYPKLMSSYGELKPMTASRFIGEIDPLLVQLC